MLNKIETSLQQTEANTEKGGFDLYQILQSRRRKDKYRCFIIIYGHVFN